ncbi:MAG: NADH-quinone oxidoreductase subunit M [Gemmatimonadaceae bacterium]|nr:NADH-quinone oxidoreductase subunit M [Gemmatimonadaceae bacterium]
MTPAFFLGALVAWPLIGALLIALLGRRTDGASGVDARALALGVFTGEALLAVLLATRVQFGGGAWLATADWPWIPEIGARVLLGADGFALVMVVMSAFVLPFALLATWDEVSSKRPAYFACLSAVAAGLMGVFLARDLLFFYVAWELLLIPMYFVVGVWGGEAGPRSALKYFIVTTLGSLLMLVAVVYVWNAAGGTSFAYEVLATARLSESAAQWCLAAFLLAFLVKAPLVPLHSWLPDAQREAPTMGALALGIKVSTFAIARVALPLFPAAALAEPIRGTVVALAVAGVVYGALLAIVQPDLKRLVSYASISHVGLVLLALFAFTPTGAQGAMLLMVNLGITTSALFILVGIVGAQRGSFAIDALGGVARQAPLLATALIIVTMSAIGLPATNGFVGELLAFIGSWRVYPVPTLIAITGVVLAAVYLLTAMQRVVFAAPTGDRPFRDLDTRQAVAMGAFVVAILWLGIGSAPVMRVLAPSAERIAARELPTSNVATPGAGAIASGGEVAR